jgi:hypothetical protein
MAAWAATTPSPSERRPSRSREDVVEPAPIEKLHLDRHRIAGDLERREHVSAGLVSRIEGEAWVEEELHLDSGRCRVSRRGVELNEDEKTCQPGQMRNQSSVHRVDLGSRPLVRPKGGGVEVIESA